VQIRASPVDWLRLPLKTNKTENQRNLMGVLSRRFGEVQRSRTPHGRQPRPSGAEPKAGNLADGEGRGTGRLVLVLKSMPKRVTADWMAQQWRKGKRTKKKLGAYPSMALAQAREVFKRDFAEVIEKGRSIRIATDARPASVANLFEGYVASLKAAGKPSWKETEKGLNKIADTLERNRLAREIESEEDRRVDPPDL
jgi:hypothetical protein